MPREPIGDAQLTALEEMAATVAVKGELLRELIRGYRVDRALHYTLGEIEYGQEVLVLDDPGRGDDAVIIQPTGDGDWRQTSATCVLARLLGEVLNAT